MHRNEYHPETDSFQVHAQSDASICCEIKNTQHNSHHQNNIKTPGLAECGGAIENYMRALKVL